MDIAQLIGHHPAKQKVTGSIPSQDICLGCGLVPDLGMCERQQINVSLTHRCFSPVLSPCFPLFLRVNK